MLKITKSRDKIIIITKFRYYDFSITESCSENFYDGGIQYEFNRDEKHQETKLCGGIVQRFVCGRCLAMPEMRW